MVIECVFGRLKAETWILIVIDTKSKFNIYTCIVLHNFCEIHEELIHQNDVSNALKHNAQFQPQTCGNYKINNNEGNGKAIRNNIVKHFN